MLNLERLRVLHAIATYGSVRGAADALRVTTSAVSQQMAKLEDELGQRVLERRGRGVRLSDAGTRLVRHTERMLSLVTEAEAELEAHRGEIAGELSVAAFASAARGLVAPAVARARTRHPELTIIATEREPDVGLPLVARGDLDVLIAQDWFNSPLTVSGGLVKSPLLDDPIDIALAATNRLAKRRFVELRDLASEPWISWGSQTICHDWLQLTLRAQGIEPRIAHHAGELQTQLAFVAAGLGICAVPRLGRGPLPTGVRTVALRAGLHRRVYAVWRADAARRPSIRATVELLKGTARTSR